jgi:hypothetical protein
MNAPAPIGHNNPPDPLDDALAPYGDHIEEAANWLDGAAVETEDQMRAVDALLMRIKMAERAVTEAKEAEAKPLHDAWKASLARYKPTLDDLARIKKGLVAAVDGFKRRLAAEKAERERKARAEADAAARAAAEAARAAQATDLEAQRAAAEAQRSADLAQAQAAAASRDKVRGLRTVTRYEVTDHRALLHWIAKHDRDAITAFVDDYARRRHREVQADGLRVWTEKAAV